MKFASDTIIEVDRELSDLDNFTLDFIRILRKHTKYVIVSGYVAIMLGRARASEDIDIIIPIMDFQTFEKLLHELTEHNFYALNAEDGKELYGYLTDKFAIRFARQGDVIPNVELKFSKNRFDELALSKVIEVKVGKESLVIAHLELQIAFKEKVLKSPKDMEDAQHLRMVAEGHLDKLLIKKYEGMLHDFH